MRIEMFVLSYVNSVKKRTGMKNNGLILQKDQIYVKVVFTQLKLKAFVQKGRISVFGRFSFFCWIGLIFHRLTCFDMKRIVP